MKPLFHPSHILRTLAIVLGGCMFMFSCHPSQRVASGPTPEELAAARVDSIRAAADARIAQLQNMAGDKDAQLQKTQSELDQARKERQEALEREEMLRKAASGDPKEKLITVYFDYNQATLNKDQLSLLDESVRLLKEYQPLDLVLIEGHCDARGSLAYNQMLGERRAQSVKRHLVASGIDADRLFIVSFGEQMPVVMGENEQAWEKNRRVMLQRRHVGDRATMQAMMDGVNQQK